MDSLENKIDNMIGYGWWKRYIAAAFWGNVSTPINLCITVLSALSTGQATTDTLLSKPVYIRISVATLVLTTLNTFFRPQHLMTESMKAVTVWTEFGNNFEIIKQSDMTLDDKLDAYRSLHKSINSYRNSSASNMDLQNFLTDFLHLLARFTILRGREQWSRGGGSGSQL